MSKPLFSHIFFCTLVLYGSCLEASAADRTSIIGSDSMACLRLYNPNFPDRTYIRNSLETLLSKIDRGELCFLKKAIHTFGTDLLDKTALARNPDEIRTIRKEFKSLQNFLGYLHILDDKLQMISEPTKTAASEEINAIIFEMVSVASFWGDGKLTTIDLISGKNRLEEFDKNSPHFN